MLAFSPNDEYSKDIISKFGLDLHKGNTNYGKNPQFTDSFSTIHGIFFPQFTEF